MHKEILSEEQLELLPLTRQFVREFYLAGGTAIALYIGHRRSVDFDLFKFNSLNHHRIIEKIKRSGHKFTITRNAHEQMNLNVNGVTFKFMEYPFRINIKSKFGNSLKLPYLIDLAAMKAYALGRRSKWKDYVDMYFILKYFFSVEQISKRAEEIFEQLFSEKLFRAQLSYFEDIDDSEPLDYLVPEIPVEEIKRFLIDKAIDIGI